MHFNPDFWASDESYVDFPRDRFLEHTEENIKNEFGSLNEEVINKLKDIPVLFATEHENADARIGRITEIEVLPKSLRIWYKFNEDHYPLTRGVLQENSQALGINKTDLEFYRTHWAIKKCDISIFYEQYLKTLTGIAHHLRNSNKKVQLIYAFNGTGKTRLSRVLKDLIAPESDDANIDPSEFYQQKVIYYNAFTEDLFYWDNDLDFDLEPKLKIQKNYFIDWILNIQGDAQIIKNFQHYTDEKLTPKFVGVDVIKEGRKTDKKTYQEITFSYKRGDDTESQNIKISKGEESNFIWSVFYTLLEQIIQILNNPEETQTEKKEFDKLEYIFIDDPVSSLDENHLIELAVNLAALINDAPEHLKFIITTHSPLFYNVLYHELNMGDKGRKDGCYLLERFEDGTFILDIKGGSANKSFSYHLHIKKLIEEAYAENKIEKFHFTLLRNLYEKTCGFLGYRQWTDLLPEDARDSYKRLINTYSHRHLSYEEKTEPSPQEKQTVKFLLDHLLREYAYYTGTENA